MKKTTYGSFFISCVFNSILFDDLNESEPLYRGRKVCVIQCEVKENEIFLYELIYV